MRVGGILTIILFIQFVNGVYGGGGWVGDISSLPYL